MLGIEPNLRWKTFAGMVIELAGDLGVSMMVTLGSLLADVPHTRPSPVTGGATDPELIERLGLQRSRYEGPTGIVGVLHDACSGANVPSVSLWAAVPHYVSLAPSPRAALALCQRLGDILGTSIDTSELEEASERYSEQVTDAVASDEETAAYVAELEQRARSSTRRRTFRQARRSPRSSRASCANASAATAGARARRSEAGPDGTANSSLPERERVGRELRREAQLEHALAVTLLRDERVELVAVDANRPCSFPFTVTRRSPCPPSTR